MILRLYEQRDFACLSALRADRQLQHLLLANPPETENRDPNGEVTRWVERRHSEGYFRIIADDGGDAIGFVQIGDIHKSNGNGRLGIALLESCRGLGWGQQALVAMHRIAQEELGLRKLLLEVRADNEGAAKLYERLGYRQVGILRSHYWDSVRFFDVMIYELILGQP
jgi:RimJ/RimL family protein N-acetyltransferase